MKDIYKDVFKIVVSSFYETIEVPGRNISSYSFQDIGMRFAAHSSKFAQTLTTKLQRASRSRIFDFDPRSPLKKFKNFQKFLKVDFSMKF